ncbi:MAG: hypothetical protein WAU10_07725, partial [Caldilineaceae bacterium]
IGLALLKVAGATGLMAATIWTLAGGLSAGWLANPGRLNDFLLLGIAGGSGVGVYVLALTLLRLPEAEMIRARLLRRNNKATDERG